MIKKITTFGNNSVLNFRNMENDKVTIIISFEIT